MSYVFVTFMQKLPPEKAKAALNELRKRVGHQVIFTPKPPPGRKTIYNINGEVVIVTFPNLKREQAQNQVTLGDVLDNVLNKANKNK